jgi:hypothetical protein
MLRLMWWCTAPSSFPLLLTPRQVFAIGLNYSNHEKECGFCPRLDTNWAAPATKHFTEAVNLEFVVGREFSQLFLLPWVQSR